jgi:hypothetical protein
MTTVKAVRCVMTARDRPTMIMLVATRIGMTAGRSANPTVDAVAVTDAAATGVTAIRVVATGAADAMRATVAAGIITDGTDHAHSAR